jgi:hypothetical protein
MYQLANPVKEALEELDTVLEFSANGEFLDELEKLNEQINSKPFGQIGNQTLANLMFDIALCHWLHLGTSASDAAGLTWLECSAKLGNVWAMSMYPPLRSAVNSTSNPNPNERIWLLISCLKGFKPSKRWLRLNFLQDYSAALEAAKVRFGQEQTDILIEEFSDSPLDLWSEEITLDSHKVKGDLGLVCEIADQQIKDLNGLQSALFRGFLQSERPWSSDAFIQPPHRRFPSNSMLAGLPYLLYTTITHCGWQFDHALDSVKALMGDYPESGRKQAIASVMSVALHSALNSYSDHINRITYQWELGSDCREQHLRQLNALMDAGANPFHVYQVGVSFFLSAILSDDDVALRAMISFAPRYNIDIPIYLEALNKKFWLLKCLENDCHRTLDYFLSQGWFFANQTFSRGTDDPQFKTGPQEQSLLHLAAVLGFPNCISVLMRHGADLFSTVDMNGLTPFTRALVEGNLGVAKLLLPKTEDGRKIIFDSVSHTGFNCFGAILSASQAMLASSWEKSDITMETFHLLRDIGAVNFIVNPENETNIFSVFMRMRPILGTSRNFHTFDDQIFLFLLEQFHEGYHINSRDYEGFPPLHRAVFRARSSTVRQMLEWKDKTQLDINAECPATGGLTALDVAVRMRDCVPPHILRGGAREITAFYQNMQSIIQILKKSGAIGSKHVDLATWAATYRELSGQTNVVGVCLSQLIAAPSLSTEESISRWVSHMAGKIFDPDVSNASMALDKYIGKWPKRWRGSGEDAGGEDTEEVTPSTEERKKIQNDALQRLLGTLGKGQSELFPNNFAREFELPLPDGFNLDIAHESHSSGISVLMPRLVDGRGQAVKDLSPMYQRFQNVLFSGEASQQSERSGQVKGIVLDLRKKRS